MNDQEVNDILAHYCGFESIQVSLYGENIPRERAYKIPDTLEGHAASVPFYFSLGDDDGFYFAKYSDWNPVKNYFQNQYLLNRILNESLSTSFYFGKNPQKGNIDQKSCISRLSELIFKQVSGNDCYFDNSQMKFFLLIASLKDKAYAMAIFLQELKLAKLHNHLIESEVT